MDELRVNVENVIRLVGIDQCGLAYIHHPS